VQGTDASGFALEVGAWGRDPREEVDRDLSVVGLVFGVVDPSLRELDPASFDEETAP